MSVLSDPKWAGIGGLAAIGAVAVALLQLAKPESGVTQIQQPIQIIQGEGTSAGSETPIPEGAFLPDVTRPDVQQEPEPRDVGRKRSEKVEAEVPAKPTSPDELLTENATTHGAEISVSGFGASAATSEVESAILSALAESGWAGLHTGGKRRLTLSGSIRDVEHTIGQIPTASASARWELRSVVGAVIGQGGVSDLLGTGPEQSDARSAAIRRAARGIAEQVVRRAP